MAQDENHGGRPDKPEKPDKPPTPDKPKPKPKPDHGRHYGHD